MEDLFSKADILLFRDKSYSQAEDLYQQILSSEPNNIDALNSIGLCRKLRSELEEQQNAEKREESFAWIKEAFFTALKVDKLDIEANFNIGLLYLQYKNDLNQALFYFQQSIKKDKSIKQQQEKTYQKQTSQPVGTNNDSSLQYLTDLQEAYRPQLAKAYYNIGMIQDRLGEIHKASSAYKKSIEKCLADQSGSLIQQPHYLKSVTNYAVTLEKLGKRTDAIKTLDSLKGNFRDEIRVYNNLGIIYKRNGNLEAAESNYDIALVIDSESFFPNYNMGVLKTQVKAKGEEHFKESLKYFEKALKIAQDSNEEVYQINVLVNIALVYERMSEFDQAIVHLERALEIDHDNSKIKQKLVQLKNQATKHQEKVAKEKHDKELRDKEQAKKLAQKQAELNKWQQKSGEQKQDEAKKNQEKSPLKEIQSSKGRQSPAIVGKGKPGEKIQKQEKKEEEKKEETKEEHKRSNLAKEIIVQPIAEPKEQKQSKEEGNIGHKDEPLVGKEEEKEDTGVQNNLKVDGELNPSGEAGRPSSSMSKQTNKDINKSLQNTQTMNNTGIHFHKEKKQRLSKQMDEMIAKVGEETFNEVTSVQANQKNELLQKQEQIQSEQEALENNEQLEEDLGQINDDVFVESIALANKEEKKGAKEEKKGLSKDQGNYKEWSEEVCLEVLKEDEENVKALFRLAVLESGNKKFQEALEKLKKVYELQPNFETEEVLLRIADICYRICDVKDSGVTIENALSYFELAQQKISPKKNYEIELGLGKCYDKMKQYSEAAEHYEKSLKILQQITKGKLDKNLYGNIEFRLGWAQIRNKNNLEQGIAHLRNAHLLIPTNPEILIKLASVLFKEQPETTSDESIKYLREAIRLQPNNEETMTLLAKILEKNEKYQESIELLEEAIKIEAEGQHPPKANSFFQLGCCYEKTKEFKKCVLNYKKCLTLDNKNFGACIHLANLLANIGEGQRAAKYFKHALRIDPDSINAHFGMGKALQQFSDNKDAPIEHFQFVIDKDPTNYKAFTQLGILYLDREEYEKSAEALKKALNINKQFPLALVSMGNLLFESGHAENAIKYHKQALKFNPKELQALIGLGNAYYDSGKPEDSINYYKNALKIDDQLSDVHYNLGNALYLIEKIEEAIEHYRAAISLNPKKSESFYNLGNALCVKNDYTNAVVSYQQALEIDPKNAPALYNLGNAFYMLNKFDDAVKVYHKALDLNEQSPECHFNLASAYNDLSQFQKAAQHYQRAIELDDKNIDAYVCMGQVQEQLKQFDKAERSYNLALQKEPDNARAKENLMKLKGGKGR